METKPSFELALGYYGIVVTFSSSSALARQHDAPPDFLLAFFLL